MKLYHFLLTSVLTAGFSSCLLAPLLFSAASNDSGLQAATALVRSGQYAEAHRLLTSALEKSSNDPRLWTLDGFALSRMGREKDALASYESALRIAPRYLPALEGAGEVKFRNRTADAADVLREVIAIRPDEQAAHAMLATLSFEHHDCQTAEAEFAKSEQAIANQSVALNQRGACLIQLNRPREAVAVFEQVIKLLPDGASAHYNLAFSLLQAGNARQAIEVLTRLPRESVMPIPSIFSRMPMNVSPTHPRLSLPCARRSCSTRITRACTFTLRIFVWRIAPSPPESIC